MAYFRLNNTKTKEENLQLAKEYAETAKQMLAEFEQVLDKVNREFKPEYGLSASKERKEKEPTQAYQRLESAADTYNRIKASYESRERMEQEKLKREKAAEFQKKLKEQEASMVNQAIKYCLDNGRQFGVDLTIENAISLANNIAFSNEIKKREAVIGDDHISFEGQNCLDECAGWNPKSNRCECGNRRVSWQEGYSSDFRSMDIHACAY